jgi:hypothetical protein
VPRCTAELSPPNDAGSAIGVERALDVAVGAAEMRDADESSVLLRGLPGATLRQLDHSLRGQQSTPMAYPIWGIRLFKSKAGRSEEQNTSSQ